MTSERVLQVVVAEDDEDLREALVMYLEEEGHRVIALEDGYELLDYIRMASGEGTGAIAKPDVIISDVRMPGRTGLDALDEARRAGLRCPILVLTGYNTPGVRKRVEALGNARLLVKPVAPDRIAEAVAAARSDTSAA